MLCIGSDKAHDFWMSYDEVINIPCLNRCFLWYF